MAAERSSSDVQVRTDSLGFLSLVSLKENR